MDPKEEQFLKKSISWVEFMEEQEKNESGDTCVTCGKVLEDNMVSLIIGLCYSCHIKVLDDQQNEYVCTWEDL